MYRNLLMISVSFVSGILSAAPDEKAEPAKEFKSLQGTWKISSVEFSGKPAGVKDAGIDRIIVAGDKMTLMNGDKTVATYAFELYPDRKPKGLLWKKEMNQGTMPLIYEVDGAKLKLCFPLFGPDTPKEAPKPPMGFETKDKPYGLIIAEKQ